MPITEFAGQYKFLSNFWDAPVNYNGDIYPTAEHAYQATKTEYPHLREWVRSAQGPGQAKFRGRRVPLRKDWEEIKLSVMHSILREKFRPNTRLAQMLLDTNDEELIEGNYWGDRYWGMVNGIGQNHLGKLLMQVRDEIRQKKSFSPP